MRRMAFSYAMTGELPKDWNSVSNSSSSSSTAALSCWGVKGRGTVTWMSDTAASQETWKFGPLNVTHADEVSVLDLTMFDNGFDAKQVRVELEKGSGYAVWVQGRIVGYLLARRDEGLLEITRLAVVPTHVRRGVGQALLELLLREHDRETSVGYLTLHVRKNNTGAMHFYLKNGLHIVGEDSGSWVMQRPLRDRVEDALFLKVR